MRLAKGKLALCGAFLVIGLTMLKASYHTQALMLGDSLGMGTMTYPRALIYIWLIASVIYLIRPTEAMEWGNLRQSARGLVSIALSVGVYIFLFETIGLIPSTFLFLLLFFWLMEFRDPKKMLLIAGFMAVLTWLVFVRLLEISMPAPGWPSFM